MLCRYEIFGYGQTKTGKERSALVLWGFGFHFFTMGVDTERQNSEKHQNIERDKEKKKHQNLERAKRRKRIRERTGLRDAWMRSVNGWRDELQWFPSQSS